MTQRTDAQLLSQVNLVFRNTDMLKEPNNSNNSMISYYLATYNKETDRFQTLLQPVYKDGLLSRPEIPTDGDMGDHEFGIPYTTSAVVETLDASRPVDHATLNSAQAPWRVVALQWVNTSASGMRDVKGIIYIGLSLSNQIDMIDTLTKFCVMVGIGVVLAGGVISAIAVQRTLNPLKRIEKVASKIADGDLSQRIPYATEGTELGSLSRSLNVMLAQIERSFRREQATTAKMKRFVSDASHELRTPLAAIHGYAELYRMQRQSPGALERADDSIAHIEASSERMTVLVEDLLSLARLDEGHGISINQQINFGSVMRDSADDLHALEPDRVITTGVIGLQTKHGSNAHLTIEQGPLPDISVVADGTKLHQVVTNIVGNIHRYTPNDSPVELALGSFYIDMDANDLNQFAPTQESFDTILAAAGAYTKTHQGTEVAVAQFIDHGPGIPEEALTRVFERFYTSDPSRARLKGGTGLGMAIAQSVINAHHGFIYASKTDGGGLTFTIVLPVEQPHDSLRAAVQNE